MIPGRTRTLLIFLGFCWIASAGCQTTGTLVSIPETDSLVQDFTPSPTGAGQPTLSASPSPSPDPSSTPDAGVPLEVKSSPTAAVELLRLSFPTPTPGSRSPWRPPVYPIPWAPNPYDHFYFSRPIAADDIETPFSNYGYGDVYFENVVHTGIDIPGEQGTPVYAAGPGKVIWTGYGYYRGSSNILNDPYGKVVAIKHSFGYQAQPLFTVYAHLEDITVRNGQYVQAGDQVGIMGETGHTTGPHLHFEVRIGEDNYFATRNPNLWLAPPQGWGLLIGQIRDGAGRLWEQKTIYLHSQLDARLQNTDQDQLWIARTYKNEAIHSDPYYQENLVFPDLPAGTYQINIPMTEYGLVFTHQVEIFPGQVSYFQFQLWDGFEDGPLPTPTVNFSPPP